MEEGYSDCVVVSAGSMEQRSLWGSSICTSWVWSTATSRSVLVCRCAVDMVNFHHYPI